MSDAVLGGAPQTSAGRCFVDRVRMDFLEDHPSKIRYVRSFIGRVAREEGYRIHRRKKASVRRRHQQQMVTGLVVNERVQLPRETRRRLRAIEHRARQAKRPLLDANYQPFTSGPRRQPTLTPTQIEGWQALRTMIARQAQEETPEDSPSSSGP